MLSLLDQPEKTEVRTESGKALPASSPKYLVPAVDISRLGSKYLTDEICVIDFGESYALSSLLEDLGIPENYLPPEVLLEEEGAIGPAFYLWALGCTLFEIRQQIPLFYMIYGQDELLTEMVHFFGKFRADWWDKWKARGENFDEQGKFVRYTMSEEWSLEVSLSKPQELVVADSKSEGLPRTALHTPEAEQKPIADSRFAVQVVAI